jgi:hypothetical protein
MVEPHDWRSLKELIACFQERAYILTARPARRGTASGKEARSNRAIVAELDVAVGTVQAFISTLPEDPYPRAEVRKFRPVEPERGTKPPASTDLPPPSKLLHRAPSPNSSTSSRSWRPPPIKLRPRRKPSSCRRPSLKRHLRRSQQPGPRSSAASFAMTFAGTSSARRRRACSYMRVTSRRLWERLQKGKTGVGQAGRMEGSTRSASRAKEPGLQKRSDPTPRPARRRSQAQPALIGSLSLPCPRGTSRRTLYPPNLQPRPAWMLGLASKHGPQPTP